MPQSFVQLAPDGAGKKMRTRQKTVGANVVQEHYLRHPSDPTWYVNTGPMAIALVTGKVFFAILNNAGSGQTIRVRKLFLLNTQLGAITTNQMQEFAVRKITTIAGGTALTLNPLDTTDGALTNVTCVHSPSSVVEATNPQMYSIYTNTDEIGATGAFPQHVYFASISAQPEEWRLKEWALAPGEGVSVNQITATATGTGSFEIMAVVTKDP